MQFTHEKQTEHFFEHDEHIKRYAANVIAAMENFSMKAITESMLYYGLFRQNVSVDDAAKVMVLLTENERIERSGVVLMLKR